MVSVSKQLHILRKFLVMGVVKIWYTRETGLNIANKPIEGGKEIWGLLSINVIQNGGNRCSNQHWLKSILQTKIHK